MSTVLATAVMVILHSATGAEIDLNTQEITNMRRAEPGSPNFTKDTHCLVNMTDGRFVAVKETCEEVRKIIGRPQ